MVLTGGYWITGRETLYSEGGRWMNMYGTMVEWYRHGETEVLGEKHYIVRVVGEWICMEQWWNGTDRGNWNTGREKFYTMVGRWMNLYRAIVEWYWQGENVVLGGKHYIVWVVGEWNVWSNDGMVLTRGIGTTGREILYSLCCRWMNVCGAMEEFYRQGETEALEENII